MPTAFLLRLLYLGICFHLTETTVRELDFIKYFEM